MLRLAATASRYQIIAFNFSFCRPEVLRLDEEIIAQKLDYNRTLIIINKVNVCNFDDSKVLRLFFKDCELLFWAPHP